MSNAGDLPPKSKCRLTFDLSHITWRYVVKLYCGRDSNDCFGSYVTALCIQWNHWIYGSPVFILADKDRVNQERAQRLHSNRGLCLFYVHYASLVVLLNGEFYFSKSIQKRESFKKDEDKF